MDKPWILLFFFSLLTLCAMAQVDELPREQGNALEQLLLNNEEQNPELLQIRLDQLQQLASEPLDLRDITFERWMETGLISELEALSYMAHIRKFGKLLALEELQAIEGWDMATVRKVLPFVRLGAPTLEVKSMARNFLFGKKEAIFRTTFPRADVIDPDWEGKSMGYFLRFRSNSGGKLRWGITAESDPGESFFAKSNKSGFDFYSAHLFVRDPTRRVKVLALGDFYARFGQGLLLEPAFALGKSPNTTSIMRASEPLRAHSSPSEVGFFRGVGTTWALSESVRATFFYSNLRRDGNQQVLQDSLGNEIQELRAFTSLQTSGLHRLPSEIEDEKTVREQTAGLQVAWQGRRLQLAMNGLWQRFSPNFQPSASPYRLYAFSGRQQMGGSIDYRYVLRNFVFFGESASTDKGGLATLNGTVFSAHRNLSLSVLHRKYTPEYNAILAAPFGETSTGTNETGLYMGFRWAIFQGWSLSGYADSWRHPWLRFRTSGPSTGSEYLLRLDWVRRRSSAAYISFQSRRKEEDAPSDANLVGLVPQKRANLRLHGEIQADKSLTLRSRVEWSFFQLDKQPQSRGVMVYQEAKFKKIGTPIAFSARYALFDVGNTGARIFAFEQDVTSAFSAPSFSGRGSRFFVNINYALTRKIHLELRYAHTRSKAIGEQTAPSRGVQDVKAQIRMNW